MASVRSSTAALMLVALCLAFIGVALAQPNPCIGYATSLQTACKELQDSVTAQKALIGADDATLTNAIQKSSKHASPACCSAIKNFASQGLKCPCDATVTSVAKSLGFNQEGLITLIRVGALSCKSFTGPPQHATCGAKTPSG